MEAKENDIVFNSIKCNIKTKFIKFFGALYDKNGMHSDSPKVEGINALKSPANEAELQYVLRIVKYWPIHTMTMRAHRHSV